MYVNIVKCVVLLLNSKLYTESWKLSFMEQKHSCVIYIIFLWLANWMHLVVSMLCNRLCNFLDWHQSFHTFCATICGCVCVFCATGVSALFDPWNLTFNSISLKACFHETSGQEFHLVSKRCDRSQISSSIFNIYTPQVSNFKLDI